MKKVLLADDVDLFLQMEKNYFNGLDVQLLTAKSGDEAFSVIDRERPDLVFLDLLMPGGDGDDCCYRVKKDSALRSTPIIMVTSSTFQDDVERCSACGADGIIFKPLRRDKFVDCLESFGGGGGRSAERRNARLLIQYGGAGEMLSDYSVNLSTGGLFLESRSLLAVGTLLTVKFILPYANRVIECTARVAWINAAEDPAAGRLPPGMGLQFMNLDMDDISSIRGYLHDGRLIPTWEEESLPQAASSVAETIRCRRTRSLQNHLRPAPV